MESVEEKLKESDDVTIKLKSEQEKNGVVPKKDGRFDKGALDGLRGLFAFHVMAFHACLVLKGSENQEVNLYGHIDMPLFFLLSGISLALAYGKTKWNGSTRWCFGCRTYSSDGVDVENPQQEPKIFDSWEFYKKRFVRLLPLHYLGIVLILIVWKYGVWPWPKENEKMWSGTFISVFAVNTWLLPYQNYQPNGPAWTISTLSFWYWCFPFIFPRLQRLTNNELAKGMIKYFWLGVGINILLFLGLGFFIPGGKKDAIYWLATAHPLLRLPVFLMGVLGGLQVLRAHSDWENFEDPNLNKNLLHTFIPWSCGKSKCCFKKTKDKAIARNMKIDKQKSMKIWKKRVEFSFLLYVLILTSLCVTKVVLDVLYDKGKDENFYIGAHRNENGTFEWLNETTSWNMTYSNWGGRQPNNHGGKDECTDDCHESCIGLIGSDDLKWHDVPCTANYRFICQYENDTNRCEKEGNRSFCLDETFYNISETKGNFEEASAACNGDGASLITVPDEKVQNFLIELINNGKAPKLDPLVKFFFKTDVFWKYFLQTFLPHLQLMIVIGLCMDGGESFVSRFLRTNVMQFLGRISLSLYLLHWPLMGVVILAINGGQHFGSTTEVVAAYVSGKLKVPFGAPAIHIAISLVVCFIVTKYFEEPITKMLKGTKS